jgi:phenylacetate-CoA ligase
VHNTFSYHFTPAGSMMETAAHALGCTVFPAGVGQTEQQVAAMLDLRPDAYAARRPSCVSSSTRRMSWA